MLTQLSPKRNPALGAVFLILMGCFIGSLPRLVADDYERLDAATKRWLALEQKIASERNGWKAQRKILEQSVLVLEADLDNLTNGLERLREEADFRAGQLTENIESFDDQEAAHAYYVKTLDGMAERFDRFRATAPLFLEDALDTAWKKLEAVDPAALGERAQILIAAFTLIEDFNRTVTIDYVPRALADGREVMVSTLYWGLARAYAVDPQGSVAWELVPGESGWIWSERPEYVEQILELVRVHEQTRPPSIQILPGATLNTAGGEE